MKRRWRGPTINVSTIARRLSLTARVTPGTPKRRAASAGGADQGQHQKQGAEITQEIDEFHGARLTEHRQA